MKTNEILRLHERVFAAYSDHDPQSFSNLVDENIIWKDPEHPDGMRGKLTAVDYFKGWLRAFPDLMLKTLNTVVGEDSIAVEYEFTGTHNGTLRTSEDAPDIEPTHKKVNTKGSYFGKVKDGKFISVHNYPDRVGLLTQLGVMHELHA